MPKEAGPPNLVRVGGQAFGDAGRGAGLKEGLGFSGSERERAVPKVSVRVPGTPGAFPVSGVDPTPLIVAPTCGKWSQRTPRSE